MRIAFVLPGRGRSGGVRVTVKMCNELLRLGHEVRLLWRRPPSRLRSWIKSAIQRASGGENTDWLGEFTGEAEPYQDLSDLAFEPDEIVIAVGAMTVKDVYDLQAPVIKVRYNHGFSTYRPDLMKSAWSVPMTTLAVAATLVPELEQFSGQRVHAVVPNGIEADQYYDMGLKRDGIGMMFSTHPNKCPQDALAALRKAHQRWPDVPQYVFGPAKRPQEIPKDSYWRYPSVARARELYNRAKVWLMTSKDEGFGLPSLEAMACGAAVVSTDNLGSAEIIQHGVNGFLVPIGDTDQMMKWVQLLLTDESKRKSIAEQGYQTAKAFSWENAVRKMEQALAGLKGQARTT